jgi:CubicO group peptidase (beta-lactamase class C family)
MSRVDKARSSGPEEAAGRTFPGAPSTIDRRRLPALAAAGLAAAAMGTGTRAAAGEGVQMNDADFQPIGRDISARVAAGRLPGAIALIARHGQILYRHVEGYADLQAERPLQMDSVLRWHSMSKAVTAVAALALIERGRLALDQPVADLAPEFGRLRVYAGGEGEALRTVPVDRPLTVRHLFAQTSGFIYQQNGEGPLNRVYRARPFGLVIAKFPTLKAAALEAAKAPLLFQPGTGWEYGISADLLGYVVEVAAGKPLQEVLADLVFRPLGMADAGFVVADRQLSRFTAEYEATPAGLRLVAAPAASAFRNPHRAPSSGGGLVGSPRDYLRFAMMLAGGGQLDGVRVLRPASVALMAEDQAPAGAAMPSWSEPAPTRGYGLGVGVDRDPSGSGRAGPAVLYWGGSEQTYFWADPAQGLAGLWMAQAYVDPFGFEPLHAMQRVAYAALAARRTG